MLRYMVLSMVCSNKPTNHSFFWYSRIGQQMLTKFSIFCGFLKNQHFGQHIGQHLVNTIYSTFVDQHWLTHDFSTLESTYLTSRNCLGRQMMIGPNIFYDFFSVPFREMVTGKFFYTFRHRCILHDRSSVKFWIPPATWEVFSRRKWLGHRTSVPSQHHTAIYGFKHGLQ